MIIGACDLKAAKNLSLTCKDLRRPAQDHVLSEIMIWGSVGEYSLSALLSEENAELRKECAKYVEAIFYTYRFGRGSPPTGTEGLLSSFIRVETLRLASAALTFNGPDFTVLKAIRFLSLENCSMDVQVFRGYVQSFPRLELLSISNPQFGLSDPTVGADSGRGLKTDAQLTVTLQVYLKFIDPKYAGQLLDVLSSAPLTGISLQSCDFELPAALPTFLKHIETVTKIRVNGESRLRVPLWFNCNLFLRRQSGICRHNEPQKCQVGGTL